MRSKRSSNHLNLSSHANARSTRMRSAWIAALNSRLRPRLGPLRLRGFSLMLGIIPAMKPPRSKLRGIKTQNLKLSKQLHLDVLTMQLLIHLCAALLLDILAYDFFIAMTPDGTDKVTFG